MVRPPSLQQPASGVLSGAGAYAARMQSSDSDSPLTRPGAPERARTSHVPTVGVREEPETFDTSAD